jgi:hypothetical protein
MLLWEDGSEDRPIARPGDEAGVAQTDDDEPVTGALVRGER